MKYRLWNLISSYKVILSNTIYLSLIEISRLVLPFVALPYLYRVVGAEKYGVVVFAQSIIAFFSIFINWGLDVSAVKDVSVHRDHPKHLGGIVSTVLGIKSCLLVVSFFVLLLLVYTTRIFGEYKIIYFYAFITCFSEIMIPIWFFQGIEKLKYLTLIRTVSILFYTVLVFVFIRSASDFIRIALLQSLSNVVAGIISLYCLLKVERISLVWPRISGMKKMLVESFPFFLSRVSAVFNMNAAKAVSGIFLSMHTVAAFDLAQKIISFVSVPIQMLNQAIYPHIARTRSKRFAFRMFGVICGVAIVLVIALIIIAPYVVGFFSTELLEESTWLVRLLCLYVFCYSLTTYLGAPVLVSFGYPRPFNYSVVYSSLVMLIVYLLLYFFNYFSGETFALAMFVTEGFILMYRLYYCFKFKVFSIYEFIKEGIRKK
ncbi:MAG: oligosaccharide flippase family protein [Oscillibacter sp.]|nr:oligosaccharide flippase family protein [Oscillibacter sp.]